MMERNIKTVDAYIYNNVRKLIMCEVCRKLEPGIEKLVKN